MLPVALYIVTVVVCNAFYHYMPTIDLGPLGATEAGAILFGCVFIFRDYVQRAVGHYVILCMLLAAVLSFYFADPYVAVASVLAFGVSEVVDWLLFTVSKKKFHQRVLLSSLLATPLDTTVFLLYLDDMTPGTFLLGFLSKMIVVTGLYIWYEARERNALAV